MSKHLWASRPTGLYHRNKHDWFYTILCGAEALLGGFSAASRWAPSHVMPVRRTITTVVTKREQLTHDVVALTLADPNGRPLPSWTPGAHIEVHLPSGRRRRYSLCGRLGRRQDYRIAVRRLDNGGRGSIEIHEALSPGNELTIAGPHNAFSANTSEQELLFVAGGIGVTPILPMIQAAQERGASWRAVYAGSSRVRMPLLDEMVAVAPDRVSVWADDERGRFASAEELLEGAGPTTAVYVCGPTAMLEAVRRARGQQPRAPLHYERFTPGPIVNAVGFQLRLARTGQVLSVPHDRSALDVLVDHDPTTPFSCRQGFCGTCEVSVVEGAVQRVAAESDTTMRVCVSRAQGAQVAIDA